MLTKSQLKEIFPKYDFRPLKRYGENYLIDGNIKDKIIKEARIAKGDAVLEIGSGLGALTVDLAESGAAVYAVEKDRKAYGILKDIVKDDYPNLRLFCADILNFDLKNIRSSKKIKVVGNLPYYITTPIIEYLIEHRNSIESALITVQREVANRFLASPETEDYGSISCFVQYYTKPSYIHTIKKTSFWPVPDVDSSLIELEILSRPAVSVRDEGRFFKIIRGAFNQRRKSIINSLAREPVLNLPKEELSKILSNIGIDPALRPQSLSLSTFATLSNALTKSH
ncbi:MAG: ribosomal RNA small subunit methyltransferase A [Candidatus Omnitrophica bacterium]|nr:ribosomal RNA small subunit methyltransferase A [Candidatus Omnitrophota bacterium]